MEFKMGKGIKIVLVGLSSVRLTGIWMSHCLRLTGMCVNQCPETGMCMNQCPEAVWDVAESVL